MVGVPGRSKGCGTCRKRKIACSGDRPECIQCRKSSRVCGGYYQDRVFVTTSSSGSGTTDANWKAPSYKKTDRVVPVDDVTSVLDSMTAPSFSSAAAMMAHTASKNCLIGTVFSDMQSVQKSFARGMNWMLMIPAMVDPTRALSAASLCVCLSRLAHSSLLPSRDLEEMSLRLYVQGLQAVQRALINPRLMYKDDTLAACMLLLMYEVYECPAGSRIAYITHQNGVGRLIRYRGPAAHQEGLAYAVFCTFRSMASLEAIMRKKTYLSEPEWMSIPFEVHPKMPWQHLIDILLECPELMDRAVDIKTAEDPKRKLKLALDMNHTCWDLDRRLQEFFDRLVGLIGASLFWSVPLPEEGKVLFGETYPFDKSLEFHDPWTGTTLVLYWATLCILYSGMCELYFLIDSLMSNEANDSFIPPPFKDFSDWPDFSGILSRTGLPPLDHRTDWIDLARNVCQSVEYCLKDELSMPTLIAPLSMVSHIVDCWDDYRTEYEWCQQGIQMIRRRGVELARLFPEQVILEPES